MARVAKKSMPAGEAVTEFGQTGLKRNAGRIDDDFVPELRSPEKRAKLYREIRDNSPVIGGAFIAIEHLLRRVEIRIEAASEDAEDQRTAEFVRQCFHDMNQPWGTTLTQALSMLEHGWAVQEIVYKRRKGDTGDERTRSKFTDGLIGWRKFAIRAQDSLDHWDIDEAGDVTGFWQRPAPTYKLINIPDHKYLLFRTTDHKGSPEGRSVLRNCVFPWKFVKRIQVIEGIGIERDLAGLPVVWAPAEVLSSTATGDSALVRDSLKTLVTNIRRDEQEGVCMPLAYDGNGNKRYDLTLLSTGGSRQFDTDKVVTRYEQRMLMALLADFILLGHEKVGSFSLSSDKTDMFAVSLAAYLEAVLEVFNCHAIPRLLMLNGFKFVEAPKLVHGDIEKPDMEALTKALMNLAGAGLLIPDEEGKLQNHMLDQLGLPHDTTDDMEVGKRLDVDLRRLLQRGAD